VKSHTLWQIPLNNPSQATKIGQIGFKNVYGLNFENGELIGFSNPDSFSSSAQRIKIDPITGKGTFDRNITTNSSSASGYSTNININGSSRIPTFDVVNTDLAGNTAATARNIGKLTTRQSFDDFIGYYNSTSQDEVDYYKFTIDQKSAVTLSVGGIAFTDGELRLELRNDKDEIIRFTDNTNDIHALLNPDSERTADSLPLLPGTYFARVTSNNSSKGGGYNFSASAKPQVENSATFRKPVFVIPGIGGSLWDISATDSKQREEEWFSKRGLDPNKLVIDPLAESYSSLIASLKDAGYQEGKDLFIVPYDWRLAPAPTDGTSDGKVSGISAVSITDGTYDYGVDYLGHYLKQASESWSASHNGQTLDSVDIIAHSTGGLIARAYMQSNAYGGQFSSLSLPLVDNLITLGVPNSGSPKAWNILNDDWNSDKVFATVFRNLAFKAYERLSLDKVVDGTRITKQSIISVTGDSNFSSEKNKIEFINQYFPSIQALLSTDDFGVAVPEKQKNQLLLDLNADSGIRSIGFNGQVSELYGDDDYQGSNGTINFIEKKTYGVIESLLKKRPLQSLTDFINLPSLPGDSYYDEKRAKNSGDGTVLTNSAKLINTSNSLSVEDTFFKKVDHGELPNNKDVINKVLSVLNQPEIDGLRIINPFAEAYQLWAKSTIQGFVSSSVSNFVKDILDKTKGARAADLLGLSEFIDGLFFSLDPVEGFIVDSQGRRLGYSKSTGALNEIPNSVWFGGAEEGIGFIKGKSDPTLKLQLSGLDENHQVTLFGVQDGKLITAESSGFLANGQTKQVPLTFTQIPLANNVPVASKPLVNASATQDKPFTLALPAGAFIDTDAGDILTYSATLANGAVLPTWLKLDTATGTFTGTPASTNLGSLQVKVTATDKAQATANSTFTLDVVNNPVVLPTQPLTLQKATAGDIWNVNGSGKVKVALLGKSTTQLNEIGIFKVDATNKVNGIAPGAAGFAKAAIESGSVVFTALPDRTTDGLALSHSFQVNNGERLGFFLVANGSVEDDLKTNNFSNVTTSADLVNPYTTSPAQVPLQVRENQGLYTLDWKQGDKNLSFNFQVDPTPDTSLTSISKQQGQKEGEVLDLRAFTGQNVQATFTLKREAAYNDSVSFYKIDDVTGTITSSSGQKFKPGDSGYVQAALNNAISGLNLAGKNGQTVTVDKVIQGGSLYAPILMSNVTASRPTGDNAFTAFSLGNGDRADHVRLLGSNTFGFEDLIGGGDKDFNDVIVQTSFKTV
jgi:hypothetical protein